jgi:hypothetical protein
MSFVVCSVLTSSNVFLEMGMQLLEMAMVARESGELNGVWAGRGCGGRRLTGIWFNGGEHRSENSKPNFNSLIIYEFSSPRE